MPFDELEQKKESQLNKEIRITSDYHADALKKQDAELFDKKSILQDIRDIDDILSEKELNLMETERARLETVKGRNLSSLLVVQEKTTGDSSQMKAVKKSVSEIEIKLHESFKQNITAENVDELLTLYDTAILACKEYMKDKSPSYNKGKERYETVRLNMIRLHDEQQNLLVAKELISSGMLMGDVENAHDLLVQAKIYALSKANGYPEAGQQKKELPSGEELKKLGKEASALYSVFSGKESPSELIERLSKSKSKKEQLLAKELPLFFANIQSSLSDFEEGKVAAKVFLLGDDLLSITQNAYGQLTLRTGNANLNIERNTGALADMLTKDIIKNENVYGKKTSDLKMRKLIRNIDIGRENTEKRQTLTDYLVSRTNYSATDFSNFFTNDLVFMIQNIWRGKNIVIVNSDKAKKYKFRSQLKKNDVVYIEGGGSLINVTETKELLQSTKTMEDRKEVQSKVTMAKKEEKKPLENENNLKENQEEKKDSSQEKWDHKEECVKNLISDMIFSYETWIADEEMGKPGKRMQLMLSKNAEAIAYLISDYFTNNSLEEKTEEENKEEEKKEKEEENKEENKKEDAKEEEKKEEKKKEEPISKLMNGILDKMPLFMMEKEASEEFKKMITSRVIDLMKSIQKEVNGKIKQALGDRPMNSWFDALGKVWDAKKSVVTGGAKMYLVTPEILLKGVKIEGADLSLPSLSEIINDFDDDMMANMASTEADFDGIVEDASHMIQSTVNTFSKELFKGEKKNAKPKLPDISDPQLSEEEKKARMRQRIKLGNDYLNKLTKDSVASGDSGLGLFTKLVFEQYFDGVDIIDKRAMIGSMMRNSKPVGKLLDENEENIDEKEKKRRAEYNKKVRIEGMANYISGMLKGAGPLFQKMMQGLPTEGIPEELKEAIKDMKSKLAPIPDEIVEAQLNNIVSSSHNQIKNIEVVKPLGAASVGQTFLCNITRADGTKEEVAIKLLKPDVRNRMMREKQLMIDCARKTDILQRKNDNKEREAKGLPLLPELKEGEKGGMQVTYEGQLERIQEELDLTIEASNVELGKIYDKNEKKGDDKVVAMKLSTLVAPTMNAMVLEKAPGETIDALLERTKREATIRQELYKKDTFIDPTLPKERQKQIREDLEAEPYHEEIGDIVRKKGIKDYSTEWYEYNPRVQMDRHIKSLAELKRKKKYLDAFARKWTTEGMFGEGFYHGDPHEGNIMVSDEKLTVIDFGNCTKLTDDHKLHVTRMLAAASVADMETFRHSFHMLLRPEFEQLYQEKRAALSAKFEEIFALGNQSSTGARIAVALLEAQKLGLEVPASVYNFSQGQMRLQNAMDHMNAQIKDMEKQILFYDRNLKDDLFDFTYNRMMEDTKKAFSFQIIQDANMKDLIMYSNDRESLKRFSLEQPQVYKLVYIDRYRKEAGKMAETVDGFKKMFEVARTNMTEPKDRDALNESYKTYIKDVIHIVPGDFAVGLKSLLFKQALLTDKEVNEALAKLEQYGAEAMKVIDAFDVMEKKHNDILDAHKDRWTPTEKESREYDALRDKFVDLFAPYHREHIFRSSTWQGSTVPQAFNMLTDKNIRDQMDRDVKSFFHEHPKGKEEFMKVYEAFTLAEKNDEEKTDPDSFAKKKYALREAYLSVMVERMKEKEKIYKEADEKCEKDFLEVMAEIISDEVATLGKRLGFFKSISFNSKIKKQGKQEAYLKEEKG